MAKKKTAKKDGGEGPQDAKNRKALAKEQKRQRQEQKANQKRLKVEKKKKQKEGGDLMHDEEDIEELVKRLDQEREALNAVVVQVASQPAPRAHGSFTVLPNQDVLMFGGERYDGQRVQVFGDLHRWSVEKNEWKRILCPLMPKARCSHQAVLYNDHVYLFGGEFSTFYQFFHFKDLWKFSLKTSVWTKLEVANVTELPQARSGHRLAIWRNVLVLFGGFHDTTRETRYFNDLYLYFFNENKWRRVEFPPHASVPTPRSGCLFLTYPQGDCIFMHGGFAKIKDTAKKVQGKTYTDTWILNLKPLIKDPRKEVPVWEKIRNVGAVPSPRTGMSGAVFKHSAIVFGGVADDDDGRVKLKSTFYNDLYSFDMERKRWFELTLKGEKEKKSKGAARQKRKAAAEKDSASSSDKETRGKDDDNDVQEDEDDEWQNSFAYFDEKGRLVRMRLDEGNPPEALGSHARASVASSSSAASASDVASSCSSSSSAFTFSSSTASPAAATARGGKQFGGDGSVNFAKALASSEAALRGACLQASGSASDAFSCGSSVYRAEVSGDAPPAPAKTRSSSSSASSCSSSSASASGTSTSAALPSSVPRSQLFFRGDAPLPRLHGHLAIRGNSLLLYGGLMELDDKEVTLDDCWMLNLSKRERWQRILAGTMHEQEWLGDDEDEEDEDEQVDEEEGSDASSDEDSTEESSDESSSSESESSDEENEGDVEESGASSGDGESLSSSLSPASPSAAVGAESRHAKREDDAAPGAVAREDASSDEEEDDETPQLLRQGEEPVTEASPVDAQSTTSTADPASPVGRPSGEREKKKTKSAAAKKKRKAAREKSYREEVEELKEKYRLHDMDETPQEGETLRLFFDRTKQHWIESVVLEARKEGAESSSRDLLRDDKELKRAAFAAASQRYEELLPCLKRLEELQLQQEEQSEEESAGRKKKGGKPSITASGGLRRVR
ncbi:kelch repeat-containing protein [Besnoitia besnoiti]|uniref:Kelch repeat-containing protein n=1 Tax=Besnoitia besnoiti TaxID=94643 RepID=A0A2A9M5C1_BESBE|nr:kelch repeat-containing protein [Besnoitia besnoiti]PFH33139.1 kelch repeat-containing protein [Besnoitia besnoiti]